jgi:cysteine synthase
LPQINNSFPAALELIGNTPLIRLQKVVPANTAGLWLKFEAGNPTGSYKVLL